MEQVTGRGFGRPWSRGRGTGRGLLLQREELFWAEVLCRLDKIEISSNNFSQKLDNIISL